jgi:hypothetical protein
VKLGIICISTPLKYLRMLPPERPEYSLNMRKYRCRLGLCLRHHGGSYTAPPDPPGGLRGEPLLIFLLTGPFYPASPTLIFATSDACERLLIILQLVPSLLLSFILIQFKLDYCNSLLLNLIIRLKLSVCNLLPMLLTLLSPKLLNFIKFLLFLYFSLV